MRCAYACGSADHLVSRRSFLGGVAAGLGVASGFSGMVQPAGREGNSLDQASRERKRPEEASRERQRPE